MSTRVVWLVSIVVLALVARASDSTVVYREIGRKQVTVGDHVVTYVRVLPPKLPLLPVVPTAVATAEEEAIAKRRESKASEFLFFSALVHTGAVTELRWRHENREFVAYSNVDFRHLTQTNEIETDSTVFSLMGVISVLDGEATPSPLPAGASFSGAGAEYLVDCSEAEMRSNEPAFLALDAIHSFYESNKAALIAATAKRAADDAAREKALAENPPKPADITVRMWRIENPGASTSPAK